MDAIEQINNQKQMLNKPWLNKSISLCAILCLWKPHSSLTPMPNYGRHSNLN